MTSEWSRGTRAGAGEIVELGEHLDQPQADQACDQLRFPARPASEPEPGTGLHRLDVLAPERAFQVLRQGLRRGIPIRGVLLQAFQADRLQVGGDARLEPSRRRRVTLEDQDQRLHHRGGAEGRPADQELVQDGPEAVDVGRRPDLLAMPPGLLGGHVAGRPQDRPRLRQAAVLPDAPGQAEVGHVRLPLGIEQDIGRLQVAVQVAVPVRVVDRACHGRQEPRGREGIPDQAGDVPREAPAIDPLHGEVEAAPAVDLVDRHDVRVVEVGRRLGLEEEPLLLRPREASGPAWITFRATRQLRLRLWAL